MINDNTVARRLRRGPARSVAVLVAGLLIAATAGAPAQAAPGETAEAYLPTYSITAGAGPAGPGKLVQMRAYGPRDPRAGDRLTVAVDATAAAAVLTVEGADESCTTEKAVTTCVTTYDSALGEFPRIPIRMRVVAGVAVGAEASLTLTASGEGLRSTTRETPVRVIASGSDLDGEDSKLTDVQAGQSLPLRPAFRVNGDVPVSRVALSMRNTHDSFTPTERYSNCWYRKLSVEFSEMYCEFELDLAPGESAQIAAETPVVLKAAADLPRRWTTDLAYRFEGRPASAVPQGWTAGDGTRLELRKRPEAARVAAQQALRGDGDGDGLVTIVTGDHAADLSATGATISAEVGATVPVRVGLHNAGPAHVFSDPEQEGADWGGAGYPVLPVAVVTLPEGTQVVSIAKGPPGFKAECRLTGPSYVCSSPSGLAVGATWTFEFRVTVTASRAASGSVVVRGGGNDPAPGNNTARIDLTAAGATPGATPGSDPGAGPTPDAGTSTTPEAAPGGAGGGAASGLPVTGPSGLLTVVAGLGVAAIGALLFVAARRRRTRFAAV